MADKIKGEEVLQLMREGWECCYAHGLRGPGWWRLQKNGLGRGGDVKHPHGQTMNALEKKGLIKRLPHEVGTFHTQYVLAE